MFEKEIYIDGLKMNYKVAGEGQPVLILHGWGGNSDSWIRVQEILASRGYKVIVPDFPSFGKSLTPPNPWGVDDYVEWLKSFIEEIKKSCGELAEPFFLLGHSFGGGLAVKIASKFSEKVKSLILVAPAIKRDKTIKYYFLLVLAKIGKPIFALPILSFLRPIAWKVLYKIVGTSDYYKLEIEKDVIMKETFRKVVNEDLLSCLPAIHAETLIIWGDKDSLAPVKYAFLINKMITGSKLEIIKGGTHSLNLEMPEKLAEIILQFLRS